MMAFDVILAVLVLGLAIRLLTTPDLFEAIVLFVSFGLALALAWLRVGAVDVALAEIALGAGVTGALLVNARRRLEWKAPDSMPAAPRPQRPGILTMLQAAGLAAAAAGSAWYAVVLARGSTPATIGHDVARHLDRTAVQNPVTAVLLDFRAYDTLLEVGVLVAGVVAVWSLERGRPAVPAPATAQQEPILAELVRWILPVAVIAAVYLTWVGSYAPGGAFQAGALLAGAAVLMLASGFVRPYSPGSAALRGAVAGGLFVFTGAALVTLVQSGAMLRWPAASAYGWIVAVEAVLAISIAAILADLFVDVPAARSREP